MKDQSCAKRLSRYKRPSVLPIFTSLLSIVLCSLCLLGTSWAWFTDGSSTGMSTIMAGNFVASVQVVEDSASAQNQKSRIMTLSLDGEEQTSNVENQVNIVELFEMENGNGFLAKKNTPYTITASIAGTANGYLRVDTCDGVYYTIEQNPIFTLILSEDYWVNITASWGFIPMELGATPFSSFAKLGNGHVCGCYYKCDMTEPNSSCELCVEHPNECCGEMVKIVAFQLPSENVVLNETAQSLNELSQAVQPTALPTAEGDASLSVASPEAAEVKVPECICSQKCTEHAINSMCEVCIGGEIAMCNGIPPIVSCTCTEQCSDNMVNTECSVCTMQGIDRCAKKPQEIRVQCNCVTRCSLDWHNSSCPVCAYDSMEKCTGHN